MTNRGQKWFAVLVVTALLAGQGSARATIGEPPSFREVYDLIRANLAGASDAGLEQAAVEGLVKQLQPRVQLVGRPNETNSEARQAALSEAAVFDGPVAYFRIAKVGNGLAQDLRSAFEAMTRTNELKGLVLDLRFADGNDYAAAGSVADLFVSSDRLLLDWGTGAARSSAKTNAIKLPAAILVNRSTSEAAEALAAVLRDVGAGLILGTNTAGHALVMDEFELKNGQRLRIARTGIKLANGEALSLAGVKPDIEVALSLEDERVYWRDPYKELLAKTNLATASGASGTNGAAGETNRPPRRRLNEADLVREHREGFDFGTNVTLAGRRESEPEKPLVRDPVLARALDLIKGLAVVRQLRAP